MFRFETILAILVFVAYSLVWISKKHIITLTGWGIPFLYKKTTVISNTVFFFLRKDSPYLGFLLYAVPLFAFFAIIYVLRNKIRTANVILFITSLISFAISGYIYYYLMTTKLLGLKNAGAGVHLLAFVGAVGIFYCSSKMTRKKQDVISTTELTQAPIVGTEAEEPEKQE